MDGFSLQFRAFLALCCVPMGNFARGAVVGVIVRFSSRNRGRVMVSCCVLSCVAVPWCGNSSYSRLALLSLETKERKNIVSWSKGHTKSNRDRTRLGVHPKTTTVVYYSNFLINPHHLGIRKSCSHQLCECLPLHFPVADYLKTIVITPPTGGVKALCGRLENVHWAVSDKA